MTSAVETTSDPSGLTAPAWRLAWLTPVRCRLILLLVLAGGFISHVSYLHHAPIDLSGDEAQYWDWSRNLDLNYYSKGPLVAYIIRASCAIFGDTMPAVRYPALLLGVATSIVTYLLTRKLFGSERLALGTVLLFHIVPMFIAGSTLMTIDPPMFFCWALATYLAAIATFDDRKWMWIAVGLAVGTGFLAKYAEYLWFLGLFGFLLVHMRKRKIAPALMSVALALLFTIPVIVWNVRHDWVTFKHISHQTGADGGQFDFGNVIEMVGSQIGAIGPTIAYLMVAAVVYAVARKFSGADPNRPKLLFLLWIGLPFLLINFLDSFRAKVQVNWPAPAYFSLVILTGYFLGNRLQTLQTWKPWRGWFWVSVLIGTVVVPIAHDPAIVIRLAKPFSEDEQKLARFDALARLRGWEEEGLFISQELQTLGPGAFVMCDDYGQTAEMAFYVVGQPKTYCAGPYYGKRLSQYDMWPDRRLDSASPLIGRDAIYLGKTGGPPPQVRAAFEDVDRRPHVERVMVDGVGVKHFTTWRCRGFKGFAPYQGPVEN